MPISSEGREHIAYLRAVRDHGFDADLRCSIRWALTRIEKLEADVIELKSFRPKRPFLTQVQADADVEPNIQLNEPLAVSRRFDMTDPRFRK